MARGVWRLVLGIVVAICIVVAFSSCAAIGALIGGTVGSLAGPAGTVGGAVAGAEAGDIVAGKKRAEEQTKKDDERIAVLEARIVELDGTIKANTAIDAHNAHLAPGETPVRHVDPEPIDPDESHRVFWIAFAAVLAVLGGTAAYIFRRAFGPWFSHQWKRISDFVRGRAPSATQPPAAPVSPPPLRPIDPPHPSDP